MRCSTSWLSEVRKLFKNGKMDTIIEISPRMLKGKQRKEFQRLLPEISLKSKIKIRVVIVELSTGEKEILITSLLDEKKFRYGIFKQLYHIRWSGEENYKFHKIRIEIENFSGKTTHAIEQDFHATVLTSNIRALLAGEAQRELDKECLTELKYEYKINQNVALGILKDEIIDALFTPKRDLKKFCKRIKQDMKKSVVPIRPGRTYERKWKNERRYCMNQRRAL
jgi:hypothetical protein